MPNETFTGRLRGGWSLERDNTPQNICGECRSIDCVCEEMEEVLNTPSPSITTNRFTIPQTNFYTAIREDLEAASQRIYEPIQQDSPIPPPIEYETNVEYNGLSEYLYTPKHERKLTLRCDNSCGAVMCQVCMSNLDYYLDF